MAEDGTDTERGAAVVEDDDEGEHRELTPDERRTVTLLGLIGFVVLLVGLGILLHAAYRIAKAHSFEEYDLVPALWGMGVLAVGIALVHAGFYRQRRPNPIPWVSTVIASVCIAAVAAVAILSVADAYLPRPAAGGPCLSNQPRPATLRSVIGQPVAFSFPEENAGTTGLRISMGRGRPAREEASQVLVRSVSTTATTPSATPTTTPTTPTSSTTTTTTTTPPSTEQSRAARRTRQARLRQLRQERLARQAAAPARLERGDRIQVQLGELQREDGARMPPRSVSATAEMINAQNMEIVVCVAPNARTVAEVDAGAYSGVLSVVDPRVTRIDVPVRVEMQFNRWPVLVSLLVGTLIVASFVLYNGTRQLAGRTAALKPSTLRAFGDWLITNPVAIGTGVVAAVAVFANQYLADSVWSGSSAEVFALIGAISAAFLGAATVAAGVDPKKVPGAKKKPPPPAPAPTPKPSKPGPWRSFFRWGGADRAPVVDDDTLGHPDDHDMPDPDVPPEVPDPSIPDDDEVAGAADPALTGAEATGDAPDDPELDIPGDEPLSPAPASGDIPLDDAVGPATGGGDIPPDEPQAGG